MEGIHLIACDHEQYVFQIVLAGRPKFDKSTLRIVLSRGKSLSITKSVSSYDLKMLYPFYFSPWTLNMLGNRSSLTSTYRIMKSSISIPW